MTTAVCFDLDGTLVGYERSYDAVTGAAFEEHLGWHTDDLVEAYTEAFVEAFSALEPEPYHAGVRSALEWARHSGPPVNGDAAVDAIVATRRDYEVAATTLREDARECLDALAADGDTHVAVVTDGVGDWQRAKLAHHGLTDVLDATVVSYEVGGHKADGDPYAAVRERLPAEEYVMVGDSYSSDVEAAREAGFVPVHYEQDGPGFFTLLRAFL